MTSAFKKIPVLEFRLLLSSRNNFKNFTYEFQAILSWLNHPENEQDGVAEEEDLEEPPKSEDDSYVDSKAEVVFTILNTFNKKDYEGENFCSFQSY